MNSVSMRIPLLILALLGLLSGTYLVGQPANDSELRARAYEYMERGEFQQAATLLERYLKSQPDDLQAGYDYTGLLLNLRAAALDALPPDAEREETELAKAVRILEQLVESHPDHEPVRFRLGVILADLGELDRAEAIFEALKASSNPAMARAADASWLGVRDDRDRREQLVVDQRVFDLAAADKHAEVVAAVDAMEPARISFTLSMQRLYALFNVREVDRAVTLADALAGEHPDAVDLAFLRAELFVLRKEIDKAVALWTRIETDFDENPIGEEARRRRLAHVPPEPPKGEPVAPASPEESRVYELARANKHREVIEAVAALEAAEGKVSLPMDLQRLYAQYDLKSFGPALQRADELLARHPEDINLAFLRGELLVQLNRPDEALVIWQQLARKHQGQPAGDEAVKRMKVFEPAPLPEWFREETQVFALSRAGRYGAVIRAVDEMELSRGSLPLAMALQRVYAWQLTGNLTKGRRAVDRLWTLHPDNLQVALLRADLMHQAGDWKAAAVFLSRLEAGHADDPEVDKVRQRLLNIPPVLRPDKWYWGEAYFSGDYFGRFGAVVGTGVARHGWFVPGARWLQPYTEFQFGVDTESGIDRNPRIIADNHVGFYGGVRLQLLPKEYLFLYAQGGMNQDLLDNWRDGDWNYDYQAGGYGFKSWGPGTVLEDHGPAVRFKRAQESADGSGGWFWRGDWFVDGSASFSYYHRYASAIGYGQARQGYRVLQYGPTLALDAYLVENISWDIKGNYFDNVFELGPGARWLWQPCDHAQVVLRAAWLNGYYMGRDDLDNRGGAPGQYDEVRVGLSVGLRW